MYEFRNVRVRRIHSYRDLVGEGLSPCTGAGTGTNRKVGRSEEHEGGLSLRSQLAAAAWEGSHIHHPPSHNLQSNTSCILHPTSYKHPTPYYPSYLSYSRTPPTSSPPTSYLVPPTYVYVYFRQLPSASLPPAEKYAVLSKRSQTYVACVCER